MKNVKLWNSDTHEPDTVRLPHNSPHLNNPHDNTFRNIKLFSSDLKKHNEQLHIEGRGLSEIRLRTKLPKNIRQYILDTYIKRPINWEEARSRDVVEEDAFRRVHLQMLIFTFLAVISLYVMLYVIFTTHEEQKIVTFSYECTREAKGSPPTGPRGLPGPPGKTFLQIPSDPKTPPGV